MNLESSSSASKWISTSPSFKNKEWFVGMFGIAVALIIVLALITDATAFVIALILTLGGVCYLVYRQIDQTNIAVRTLYESEQRFRLLVNEVCDYAIFGLDPVGKVTSWNTGAQRMTGYDPVEILQQPFAKLCVGEIEGGVNAELVLAKAVKEGRVTLEAQFVRRDGSRYLTSTVVTPLEDEHGRLRGFSIIATDITARKQAEEELRASHQFIQRVTAALPDMLFIVDLKEERLVFINDEAEHILGYSTDQLQKLGPGGLRHLLHTEDHPWAEALREKAAHLKDGEVFQFEARLRDVKEEWRWFSIRSVVFSRQDGAPTQTLCLAQDLTMLKRAQEDVRRFEQIALSRERLALLGELSASVAHEFRNPLLGVQHCVEELRSRCGDDPGMKGVVDLLEEGLSRMDHVSGRLLRLARNDDGSAKALSDIASCVEGTCGFVRSHAQRAGVQLHSDVEPNLPQIKLHPERLSEAMLNLIYNAIDACKPGDSVSVRVRQRPAEEKMEILVSDTGTGIPAELREKIFEAFFTTKAAGRGTGLGMTIVRRIIEAHGGTIELLEQEAKGTTFRILLPMNQ